MISLSCHVSEGSGGEGDFFRERGCDAAVCGLAVVCFFESEFSVVLCDGEDVKAVCFAKAAMFGRMRGCCVCASGRGCDVSGISLPLLPSGSPSMVSRTASCCQVTVLGSLTAPVRVCLSSVIGSSFGFFRTTSSVGVSGDMGIGGSAAMVMPRSWSATAFLGLSAPVGVGLPRGGVDAVRSVVFRCGTNGGGLSRLRLGEGYAVDSWVGGITVLDGGISHLWVIAGIQNVGMMSVSE